MRIVDPVRLKAGSTFPLKNHRGNLAALRKAPQRLNEKQRSRLEKLFAAHPVLKTLHDEMHQLRDLMNHKHQTQRKCRELIPRLLQKIRLLKETCVSSQSALLLQRGWAEASPITNVMLRDLTQF